MESDDDYQSLSPFKESSPPARKLKRLKRVIKSSDDPLPNSSLQPPSVPLLDSSNLKASPESPEAQGSEGSNESLGSHSRSEGFDDENKSSDGSDENSPVAKRVLDFGSADVDFDGTGDDGIGGEKGVEFRDLEIDSSGKGRPQSSEFDEDCPVVKRVLEFGSADVDFDGTGEDAVGGEKGVEFGDLEIDSFEKGRSLSSELNEDRSVVKRVLEFDSVDMESGGVGEDEIEQEKGGEIRDLKIDKSKKKRRNSEGIKEGKEKKMRVKKSDGDDTKPKASASNKRKEEKERREHLQNLHAESQRLLRETSDAAFKPVPLVQKSISSVLEKIRKRKLEVSKKTTVLKSNSSIGENAGEVLKEIVIDINSDNDEEENELVIEKVIAHPLDAENGFNAAHIDGTNESTKGSSNENIPSQMVVMINTVKLQVLDEESKQAFRAPIEDTQDLIFDTQASDTNDDVSCEDDHHNTPEEPFAPSLLAMNLKLDSAPPEYISSDEEDNEKENLTPHLHGVVDLCPSPEGAPVKAFLDDEAEEEDDSDNDLLRFEENEDDDAEDAEELHAMIATQYEENPIDGERRNQLHQKWLEQQDAAGTDDLLKRLNCGTKHRDTIFSDYEEDMTYDEDEEGSNEAAEDRVNNKVARISSRKAKQMIPQMFTDKDDVFLSDDEETEQKLVKQRVLKKAEEQTTFLSPLEDESSREVFGLIKKMNIVPDTKKKAKTSSILNMLVTSGNSNSSSKSSFLSRTSSNSLPSSSSSSSRKHGANPVRSYIFGRDDSNSRSEMFMSEDSSEMVQKEVRPIKAPSAKFTNSQSKSGSQKTKNAVEAQSNTSLFEILKRSSMQSNQCTRDETVVRTQKVFASFKLPKKPIRVEGGS